MEIERTEGIILKTIKFRDTDQIITIFTEHHGLLSMVVRGAYGKQYSQGAWTAPLSRNEFVYTPPRPGKSDLAVCRDIAVLEQHLLIRQDFGCLEAAVQILEATISTQFPCKPSPEIYRLLNIYLKNIARSIDPYALAASYSLKLLHHEGMISWSTTCATCNSFLHDRFIYGGEPFCVAHAPAHALYFSEEEAEMLIRLAGTRSLRELLNNPLPTPLYSKIKELFLILVKSGL